MEEVSKVSNPYEYVIERVVVTADRWREWAPEGYDIKNMINEISFFESLDTPYLSAQLAFLDNANLGDRFPFQGTERVEISIFSGHEIEDTKDNSITKRFIVNKVTNTGKSNDNNEIVLLHLIEERAYQSNLMNINRIFKAVESQGGINGGGFRSSATDIIQSLLRELDRYVTTGSNYFLSNELLFDDRTEPLTDGDMKVIIPNMGPLDAISWLCDRCVTSNGYPFFVFASMGDDKVRFLDLETMLRMPALNNIGTGLPPYTYSEAIAAKAHTLKPVEKNFLIKNSVYKENESQNLMNVAGIGPATYNFIDTFQGTVHVRKHNPGETFARAKMLGIFDENDIPVYDDKAVFAGKNIGQYNATTITNITTSRSQSGIAVGLIDNIRSYNEYQNGDLHNLKVTALGIRGYLHKSALTIQVPGKNFLAKDKNMTISNKIRVEFKKNAMHHRAESNQELDIKKSGDYIIYSAKHTFSPAGDGTFSSTLGLVKLAHEKR
tara:strand:- start:956 stop:2437 length:1482 start_codon:yes stop_codon:yes gene_type:complete